MLQSRRFTSRMITLTAIITLVFALTSCGESDNSIKVTAKNMFDGTHITINVSGRDILPGSLETTGYVTFKSHSSIDDIYNALKTNLDFTAVKYSDAVLLERSSGTYSDYYCISKSGKRYVFGGMCGNLIVDIKQHDDHTEKVYKKILFPVHLIADDLILEGELPYYTLYANVDYKVSGSIDDFLAFYRNCRWYDVDYVDNLIMVKGWKCDPATMDGALNYGNLSSDIPFSIHFTEKNGDLYLQYTTTNLQ